MKFHTLFAAAFLAGSVMGATAIAQPAPPLTYAQPLAPAAVRIVQDRLRQLGLYSGRVDGVWGSDSAAALQRFQETHGLQVTGQLNAATAATLGLNPPDLLAAGQPAPPAPPPPAGAAAAGTVSPDAVRAVQTRLRALNFYSGPVDGVWGGATQGALQRFQEGQGLQPNGQLNPATISALGLDPNMLAR